MRPGISTSESSISRRPKAARDYQGSVIEDNKQSRKKHTRSATLNFCAGAAIVNVCVQTVNC